MDTTSVYYGLKVIPLYICMCIYIYTLYIHLFIYKGTLGPKYILVGYRDPENTPESSSNPAFARQERPERPDPLTTLDPSSWEVPHMTRS